MTDKEFDKILRGKLEEFQPEYDQNSWEDLEKRIENEVDSANTDPFDNAVRAALSQFALSNSDSNWEEMERMIVEDENNAFDQDVRETVTNYEAPYDASSWPILDTKISEDERFHRRLIGAKILEIAAILIALITFYNVFPDIKQSLFDGDKSKAFAKSADTGQEEISNQLAAFVESEVENSILTSHPDADVQNKQVRNTNVSQVTASEVSQELLKYNDGLNVGSDVSREFETAGNNTFLYLKGQKLEDQQFDLIYPTDAAAAQSLTDGTTSLDARVGISSIHVMGLPKHLDADIAMANPKIELGHTLKSLRFSIGASMDLNSLYMPQEEFYTNGERITFSEKTLAATGYSAGLGLLFGGGAWSFETGLFYSSKKYEPNRIIQIGKTFDVRTLDFSEINLHIVSVPLYAHWNFDRKGKTRFYAVVGSGINIIATANYDLITKNNIRSGPSGFVPDKKTDSEVARVREHILDGAEFSSKSFVTVVGGLGVEHKVGGKLSIFAQPMFNYQVPFFHFSDHNGKQLQYLSMQFGTRVKLR